MNLELKKIFKNATMLRKYEAMQSFRNGARNVITPPSPQMVQANILQSLVSLQMLKELKEVVEADIKALKFESVNLDNVINRNYSDEMAEFIVNRVCLYSSDSIKRDYEACKKAEKLNAIYPIDVRKEDLKRLTIEIEKIGQSVEALREIDENLAKSQAKKLQELIKEKDSIEGTLFHKDEQQIRVELYGIIYNHLDTILEGIKGDINRLERNLG